MKKTASVLLAGLLAAGGVFAQSAGDTALTATPSSPSQSLNAPGAKVNSEVTAGAFGPNSGTAATMDSNNSAGMASSSMPADRASSTMAMGAGPAQADVVVVPVVPVAVVGVVPAATPQPEMFGRANVTTGAIDTGNGTLEGNGGPYDNAWWGNRGAAY